MRVQDIDSRLSRITSFLAAERFSAAASRVSAALKYNPNSHLQPRVPAGDPEGGQWMPSERAIVGSLLPVLRKVGPPALRLLRETARRIAPVMRRLPRRWDETSQFPDESDFEEETRRISSSSWQRHGYPNIRFRSEDELRRYLGPAGPGREWHHIVEKRLAGRDGLPVEVIHSTDNIISLPVDVHRWVSVRMSSRAGEFQEIVRRFGVERLTFGDQYNFGLDLISEGLEELGYDPSNF